ncbi:MAG: hypothetical protein K0M70_12550 [Arenimonas sp.]|uniref:hypothetical protein n=1 Tax=Arenimonas sp. TaxID=1872635 RepID=UPI0025C39940|nr:hypothetical protein [Arenimonas sp.]MBW8368673.1 hypothetical protein [Arenimonas sp.]
MFDLLKAEFRRFLPWALVYAAAHLMVLLFLTRLVDLAQQSDEVYLVIGAVLVLTGLLLGLLQMGSYRRPNAWLQLLHRPLPHWRIALALLAAGAALLLVALLLPLLATAAWQASMTPRVLDARHVALCLAGFGGGVIGYFSGAAAMLVPRRTAMAPLVFITLLPGAYATGMGLLALQALVAAWLLALTLVAFKPDLGTAPRGVAGVLLAAPLQVAMWLLLVLAGFAFELLWVAQGSHPNSIGSPAPGSAKHADEAEAADLLVAGLASSTSENAALWREQAAISDIVTLGVGIPVTAMWNELSNRAPMEFDDEERRIRWVFSHDRGRFVGYRLSDRQVVGVLGVNGDGRFDSPPLPGPRGLLIARHAVYAFDGETQRVLPRVQLPDGEVVAGVNATGERLAVLSDRALYLYDARPLSLDGALLATRQRIPLPDAPGNVTRVDVMELLEGHLVSFTMTRQSHNGQGRSFQQITRVDSQGRVTVEARRALATGYGPLFTSQTWWPSPAISEGLGALRHLFAPYQPGYVLSPPPRPGVVLGVAALLMGLSLLAAAWHVRRTALYPASRMAWCLACAAFGVPAFMALWLAVPPREVVAPLPAPAVA